MALESLSDNNIAKLTYSKKVDLNKSKKLDTSPDRNSSMEDQLSDMVAEVVQQSGVFDDTRFYGTIPKYE